MVLLNVCICHKSTQLYSREHQQEQENLCQSFQVFFQSGICDEYFIKYVNNFLVNYHTGT
jgi:hypothetical protein